jgi:hypothetical protein
MKLNKAFASDSLVVWMQGRYWNQSMHPTHCTMLDVPDVEWRCSSSTYFHRLSVELPLCSSCPFRSFGGVVFFHISFLPFISAEFSSDLDFYSTSSSSDSFFSTIRIPPPLLSPAAALNYFSSSCRSCSNFHKQNHLTSGTLRLLLLILPVLPVCLSDLSSPFRSSSVSRCHYSSDKTLQIHRTKSFLMIFNL